MLFSHIKLKLNCVFSKQIYLLNNDAMKPKYIIEMSTYFERAFFKTKYTILGLIVFILSTQKDGIYTYKYFVC